METGLVEKSAVAAGYNEKYGSTLLAHPLVKAEIERRAEALAVKTGYTLQTAFDQAQRLLKLAEESGQMMAAARFHEISCRLHNLLTDRVAVATVDLTEVLRGKTTEHRNPELEATVLKMIAGWPKKETPPDDR
jgi:hypothetical protein